MCYIISRNRGLRRICPVSVSSLVCPIIYNEWIQSDGKWQRPAHLRLSTPNRWSLKTCRIIGGECLCVCVCACHEKLCLLLVICCWSQKVLVLSLTSVLFSCSEILLSMSAFNKWYLCCKIYINAMDTVLLRYKIRCTLFMTLLFSVCLKGV